MDILHSDRVVIVPPGSTPNYNSENPLLDLMTELERVQFACDREWYLRDSLDYLFPFDSLELYGPQGRDANIADPTLQDNKTDFQKQNVKSFVLSSTHLTRGWVTTGDWTGPFLRLSYQAGPDSPLWKAKGALLGPDIRLWLKVGANAASTPLVVPYNPMSDRYEVELWGYTGTKELRSILGGSSLAALDRGELQVRNDLVRGNPADFHRENLMASDVRKVSSDCTMHPILPLHIECAWADRTLTYWDSNQGRNYHYEFNMIVRGWDNFLSVGTSANPHGGVGFLEYRNLLSNYGAFAGSGELARQLSPWNFDAFGSKDHGNRTEPFLAAEYFDLHVLRPECGIGLHRHRDNQEVFFMLNGRGFMIVGDWCKMPQRQRCFEIRTLRPGHFAMLKGGNLHALVNSTDENISLFMFGGYD